MIRRWAACNVNIHVTVLCGIYVFIRTMQERGGIKRERERERGITPESTLNNVVALKASPCTMRRNCTLTSSLVKIKVKYRHAQYHSTIMWEYVKIECVLQGFL